MAEDPKGAASQAASSATETLSQLLARILNQLALSAWLPSAALTLLFAFMFQLGSVLDGAERSLSPGSAISQTFQTLGKMSIGALILLVVVIIVLTMLTQAFSFEAIRILEGYWGTSRLAEAVAGWRCERFRRRRRRLDGMLLELNKRAWLPAEARITEIQ
ncbi:hypothetical protein [Blastococcus sp. LR1]|uniref:hypothetical protein n=1 Tax=Blastococcus sp. LR1 TaxID=2877000 RepID=UPI001CCE3FF9|nr:hypothetical protein [Blastococcus sp. LR1]MCA0143967.1 hypothetical protein [Blastococcus sp. LR1]